MGNEEKISVGSPEGCPVTENPPPENLRDIVLEGMYIEHPSDPNVPNDNLPSWIDRDKLDKGRKFAMDHYSALCFSQQISLYLLFSTEKGLAPLIYTKKSGTPYTAFKRYLSTGARVRSWFETDPLDKKSEAYRNLTYVRRIHLRVSKELRTISKEKYEKEATLDSVLCPSGKWAKICHGIKEEKGCPFKSVKYEGVHLSQGELSFTQFGFMGLAVLFPEKFGLFDCEEELECYVHLWRVLGYLLGIEDKYNFCSGSLQEVRLRSANLLNHYFIPNLLSVNHEWEHMSICVTEGISFYFKGNCFGPNLGYLLWILNLITPQFYEELTFYEKFRLGFIKFSMCNLFQYRIFHVLGNKAVMNSVKKIQGASEKTLKILESQKYKYEDVEENKDIFCTHL